MREDIAKVICERPRRGQAIARIRRKERRRIGQRMGEDAPRLEGMKPRQHKHTSTKELDDFISPVYRWLDKQVGRPWTAIESEFSARLKPGYYLQRHVLDHIYQRVSRFAHDYFALVDGVPYRVWDRQLESFASKEGSLYVDAQGVLRRGPRRPKRKVQPEAARLESGEHVVVWKGRYYAASPSIVPDVNNSEKEWKTDVRGALHWSRDGRPTEWQKTTPSAANSFAYRMRRPIPLRAMSSREIRQHKETK